MKFIRVLKASLPTFDKSGYYDLTNESAFKSIIAEFMERIKYTFPKNIYDSSAGIDENQFNEFKSDFNLEVYVSIDNLTKKLKSVEFSAYGYFKRLNGAKSGICGNFSVSSSDKLYLLEAERKTLSSYSGARCADDVNVRGSSVRNIFNKNFTGLNEKNVIYVIEFLFDLMYNASKEWIEGQLGAAKNTYQGD